MRKTLQVVAGSLLLTAASHAAPGGCGSSQYMDPFAFETLTVSTTALGLTATVYTPSGRPPADMAIITLETDAVRYRVDGINPTATVGHVFAVNSAVTVCGPQSFKTVRFIRVTADASMSVSYYRQSN